MNIHYETNIPNPNKRTFKQLLSGQWYRGVQTGRIYFFYESEEGKPRLLRCDDNQDCTSRFQRGGSFVPIDVTRRVHGVAPKDFA